MRAPRPLLEGRKRRKVLGRGKGGIEDGKRFWCSGDNMRELVGLMMMRWGGAMLSVVGFVRNHRSTFDFCLYWMFSDTKLDVRVHRYVCIDACLRNEELV